MKPRIEKKLSKRLAKILCGVRGFTPKDVWIDGDVERFPRYYKAHEGELTPKQKRKNYEQKVSVNHIPSIGGNLDYWGEGTDWSSVFDCAKEMLIWTFPIKKTDDGAWPHVNMKLTGKNVVALAKRYAQSIKVGE